MNREILGRLKKIFYKTPNKGYPGERSKSINEKDSLPSDYNTMQPITDELIQKIIPVKDSKIDKRRFINSKAYRFTGTHSETKFNKSPQSMVAKPFSLLRRNVQIPRNGIRMTQIRRIFTDNPDPCTSVSSAVNESKK